MKGGDGRLSFTINTETIQDYQVFYNLSDNTNPGCSFLATPCFSCSGCSFQTVYSDSNGTEWVLSSSFSDCRVTSDGVLSSRPAHILIFKIKYFMTLFLQCLFYN